MQGARAKKEIINDILFNDFNLMDYYKAFMGRLAQ